jgi:post-segregation antitoxin (ccd killing protein)
MVMATVSVRIPRALKAKLRRQGVPISKVTREALEAEARRRDEDEFERARMRIALRLKGKVDIADVVADIRETREER